MSPTPGAVTIVAAALVGGVVGAAAVLFLQPRSDPLAANAVDVAEVEVRLSGDLGRLAERVRTLEAELVRRGDPGDAPDPIEALRGFREALRGEFERVDARLGRLEEDLSEVAVGVAHVAVSAVDAADRPLTEEQQRFWAARSRDEDPGERFSALVILGAERTEIGVQVCLERLAEPGEETIVLWQALRNLGVFRERARAASVADFLAHDRAVIRAAAFEALRWMGAPEGEFDPAAAATERRLAADALRAWASGQ